MLDQIAHALAAADGAEFVRDAARYRKLAAAALKQFSRPTEAMIDAAYEAVRFDEGWAINSRAAFRKAVVAMVRAGTKKI